MNAMINNRWCLVLGCQALAAMCFLTACSTAPVKIQAVGPEPPVTSIGSGPGKLVVYSDTEAKRLDKGLPYYVHTSYIIENQDGTHLRWVPNHLGDMDQSPQMVTLAPGVYQIVAESSSYGQVEVPVEIEAGRTTQVHLDGISSQKSGNSEASGRERVCLPDGETVGWRANIKN